MHPEFSDFRKFGILKLETLIINASYNKMDYLVPLTTRNMLINKFLFSFILLFISTLGSAQIVNTIAELNSAINGASPGSIIILADGTWNNVIIDIDKNGNASNPITITAQNPGNVLLTGNSRVIMEGAYITLSGLIFQEAANLEVNGDFIEPIIELDECDYCKVINNKIDNFNGTEAQKNLKFKWILNDGVHNEIAFNSFIGKYGVGSIINDNRNSSEPDYLLIHHNYFADRTPINQVNEDNDQDAIRIGNSSTSLDDSFTEVFDNYFYNFFGEIEVISNKSGQNKYYNNTFREYSGTLALRHGNNCEVYGNYFFANDNFLSGGIRVIGEDHKVYNNYIEGVNSTKPDGSTSKGTGGINISNGRLNSELNGYFTVKNAEIANNTFVNCDYALRVGTSISSDLDEEPVNLIIANNITYNSSINDYQISTAPSGNSISEGNLLDLANSALNDDGNFHRLTIGSTPINASVGNYSYITEDILRGNRDSNIDAGAEEFGAGGNKLPYNNSDVGVSVGFGASSGFLNLSYDEINIGVCGGSRTFEVVSNVDWEITENLSWLELDITSGSGSTTVTATATENISGADRPGNIVFNQVGGGISTDLEILQSVTSIAFDVPITGTSSMGMQNEPDIAEENAYNNDFTNYWTGNPDTEPEVSITFDLGSLHFLAEIGIHFWKSDERTTTFSIEIADDAAGPFTTVIDNGVSEQEGTTVLTEQIFSLGNNTGRYVKFIGHGNSSATNWTSIANVNIYGDVDCENAISSIFNLPENEQYINVFPVPISNGVLNIQTQSKTFNKIEIFNITGQKLMTIEGDDVHSKQINVSILNAGIYVVKLEGIGHAKFIIK